MAGQIQIYLQQRDAGILGQISRVEIPYLNAMTDTIGNPAPVVAGGRVVLLFCRDNRAILVLSSLDADGREWPSAPVDVTLPALGTSKPIKLTLTNTGPTTLLCTWRRRPRAPLPAERAWPAADAPDGAGGGGAGGGGGGGASCAGGGAPPQRRWPWRERRGVRTRGPWRCVTTSFECIRSPF